MSALDLIVVLLFSAWFALSVAGQFDGLEWMSHVRKRDVIGCIPTWTFFAPRPGMSDSHLIYRQVGPQSPLTDWMEVPLISRRRWYHFVWNPERRRAKVISDCMNQLGEYIEDAKRDGVGSIMMSKGLLVSIPYLTLLSMVMRHGAANITVGSYRQFAVAERTGAAADGHVRVVLCSPLHSCGGRRNV